MQHIQIRKLLKNSTELEKIVKDNLDCYKYPAAVAQRYLQLTWEMMDLKRGLANFYHQQAPPVALFHLTIKCHYLVHIALLCKYLSPSRIWNYSGEAMMKRLKALVTQNTDGAEENKPGRYALPPEHQHSTTPFPNQPRPSWPLATAPLLHSGSSLGPWWEGGRNGKIGERVQGVAGVGKGGKWRLHGAAGLSYT